MSGSSAVARTASASRRAKQRKPDEAGLHLDGMELAGLHEGTQTVVPAGGALLPKRARTPSTRSRPARRTTSSRSSKTAQSRSS